MNEFEELLHYTEYHCVVDVNRIKELAGDHIYFVIGFDNDGYPTEIAAIKDYKDINKSINYHGMHTLNDHLILLWGHAHDPRKVPVKKQSDMSTFVIGPFNNNEIYKEFDTTIAALNYVVELVEKKKIPIDLLLIVTAKEIPFPSTK